MLPLDFRSASAPPLNWGSRWLLRRLCTDNPFYVLSAALFLVGLWGSFTAEDGAEQTWALLTGLSGYTLLLAVTACLANASDSATSFASARSTTGGRSFSARCVCTFIEQNFGPHIAQNSAVLNASCGSVSSCFFCAASGSSERRNCSRQSNA